jgi:hypothetical protein
VTRDRLDTADTARIACAELSSARLETIKSRLGGALATAVNQQPTLLILDDLDALCPLEQEVSALHSTFRIGFV